MEKYVKSVKELEKMCRLRPMADQQNLAQYGPSSRESNQHSTKKWNS